MGAWGSGPFDNDDAADWAWQLTDDADEAVVRAALAAVASDSSPDAPMASCAIAAADRVPAGSAPAELWGDAEDSVWGEEVDDLRARLQAAG